VVPPQQVSLTHLAHAWFARNFGLDLNQLDVPEQNGSRVRLQADERASAAVDRRPR